MVYISFGFFFVVVSGFGGSIFGCGISILKVLIRELSFLCVYLIILIECFLYGFEYGGYDDRLVWFDF